MIPLQTSILETIRAVALGDPISTVLFAMGVLVLGASITLVGLLALGAVIDFFVPQ